MERNHEMTLGWVALGSLACAALVAALRKTLAYNLKDKVVLVTGGSRGLGLLLAREFVSRGSIVAVCARNGADLQNVQDEYSALGRRFMTYPCDLGDRQQVLTMIEEIENRLGPIDVLVNNAGIIQVGPLENQGVEDFEAAMRSNFWSAVHTALAVIPGMRRRKSGRIVNITSIGGKIAVPHLLPYCASKFALVGFSKGLRAELAKNHIVVTTAVPGLMRTGSPRNVETVGQHGKEYSWFILGDSLPGISIDGKVAAETIVNACVAGKGEVVIGRTAQIAAKIHASAPNFVDEALAIANQWLLPAAGNENARKRGFESENWFTRTFLTALTRQAALENNEV